MRCKACDKALSDFESTRKSIQTGEFIDLCNHCFQHVKDDVNTMENQDLMSITDIFDIDEDQL